MSGHFLRGQVWEYVAGSQQYRVVIISGDEYNATPQAAPWALTIVRQTPPVPGYLIRLADGDPLAGASVVLPNVLRCQQSAFTRHLGYLSEATMGAVENALRDFLTLP